MERLQETGMVDWRPRSGRPLKTTHRNDRLIALCVRRNHFSTSARNRDDLNFRGNVSVRTANRRRNEEHLYRRRPIKRPPLSVRHRRARWICSRDHIRWNIRNWKRLSPLVTWMTAFESSGIGTLHFMTGTTAFGGGGVTVWGCFSFNCKLDLHVLQGNINGVAYRDNVLSTHVVPYFDNHPLADRPIFMDDKARPQSSHCKKMQAARGDWHISVACHVPWCKPNRAHMGLCWP